jgi:hypothetical protein
MKVDIHGKTAGRQGMISLCFSAATDNLRG